MNTHLLSLSRRGLGAWGEQCAKRHLKDLGWDILDTNWRIRGGELDIVASDPQRSAVVAVEVKTRRGNDKGSPLEAVTSTKIIRLRALLAQWLAMHNVHANTICVDVVGVSVIDGELYTIDHVKDVML